MAKYKVVGLLALLIAVIAPLWAASSAYFGLQTGAVALISAGIYVASGSKVANGLKITLGFLAGNLWAYLASITMDALGGTISNPFLLLFLTLFFYAIIAVFIACYLDKFFDLSSWLAGWAVTLSLLPLAESVGGLIPLVLHIAIAMVAGVWLVGVLITSLHRYLLTKFSKESKD